MQKGIIRLCYRELIDIQSTKPWEKLVFEDTWTEFLMQDRTKHRVAINFYTDHLVWHDNINNQLLLSGSW